MELLHITQIGCKFIDLSYNTISIENNGKHNLWKWEYLTNLYISQHIIIISIIANIAKKCLMTFIDYNFYSTLQNITGSLPSSSQLFNDTYKILNLQSLEFYMAHVISDKVFSPWKTTLAIKIWIIRPRWTCQQQKTVQLIRPTCAVCCKCVFFLCLVQQNPQSMVLGAIFSLTKNP